ncbi:MAG: arabinose isomerase [Phycisphaerae bacterium]|nr:arabinose isomerase [Phycisphaerae bacterium]
MLIPRRKPRTARIGIFAVGHDTYWAQFDGLLDELMGYHAKFKAKVEANGVEVVDFGMIDDAKSAYTKVRQIKAADLDLVFCDMVTYATSSTWAIIHKEVDAPIVLAALQPLKAMDYKKACTYMQLCNDNICSVPEFTGVSVRMGKRAPEMILGVLEGDAEADADLAEWCDVAKVLHDLRGARIGAMGHVLENMYDMQADHTMFSAHFGLHVVQTEADDLLRHYRGVSESQIKAKRKEIDRLFDYPDPGSDPIATKATDKDLNMAAQVAVALDKFIEEHELDGLAYYYEASPDSELRKVVTNLIVGNSLLTAAGFPMCGEFDLKTCVGMMIMDRLDIGGSFAEFHPIDFNEGFVLVGHDGPHHINVADGKPVLRSLLKYHGKPGSGASVEFKLKEGPISMLGVTSTYEGKFKFVIAEGESVHGPIPPTGNTNTRGFFKPDIRTFLRRWMAEGPTHHYALGIGHRARALVRVANCLGIESVVIGE